MLLGLAALLLLALAAVGVVAVGKVHNPMVTINERNSSNVTVSESPDDSFNNWNERGRTVCSSEYVSTARSDGITRVID